MVEQKFCVVFFCVSFLIGAGAVFGQAGESNWGQWRGPLGTGEAVAADPPVRWSETENIKWKAKIPGLGHSSPVVWENTIVVTTAVPVGKRFSPIRDGVPGSHDNLPVTQKHQFLVIAFERSSGRVRWRTVVQEAIPREGAHYTASLASASPVTDGNCVYASFGSHGLYCLSLATGQVIWEKQFAYRMSKHGHGEGASPALFKTTLILNWDNEQQSFVAAYDTQTGAEKWKVQRDEVTSWSSPLIVKAKWGPQAIIAGSDKIRGYDLKTGEVVWSCGGMSQNIVATPVANKRMVFVGSSYEKRAMFGIEFFDAKGDITGSPKVRWAKNQRTPYVPSPLLYQGKLYYLRHYQGILSRIDANSGEEKIGPFRLSGFNDIYASPVAAADKIYIADRSGAVLVLSHSELPRKLSINRLEDRFSSTPALIDQQIILRGEKSLYLIEKQ